MHFCVEIHRQSDIQNIPWIFVLKCWNFIKKWRNVNMFYKMFSKILPFKKTHFFESPKATIILPCISSFYYALCYLFTVDLPKTGQSLKLWIKISKQNWLKYGFFGVKVFFDIGYIIQKQHFPIINKRQKNLICRFLLLTYFTSQIWPKPLPKYGTPCFGIHSAAYKVKNVA